MALKRASCSTFRAVYRQDLVRCEIGADSQGSLLGWAFPSNGAGIFRGDVVDERDNVKTHHYLIRMKNEVMGEIGELF